MSNCLKFSISPKAIKKTTKKFRKRRLIHAGKKLGIIFHEDAVCIMEDAHLEVFGKA
jgi:hypothetical protein